MIAYVSEKVPAIAMVKNTIENKIGKFTKNEIMEFTFILSKAYIEKHLKKLTEDGTIIRHRKGKNTFYSRNY